MRTEPKWYYLTVADSEAYGCAPLLIRYRCAERRVSKEEIEAAINSYFEDKELCTDMQMIEEVLSSFEGLEFEILPYEEIWY